MSLNEYKLVLQQNESQLENNTIVIIKHFIQYGAELEGDI